MTLTFAQAVQSAIATERSGARFYAALARITRDPDARQILVEMQAEEEAHAASLAALGPGLPDVALNLPDPAHADEPEVDDDLDLHEALDIALDAERHAAFTYAELAFRNEGAVSELFQRIAKEEERHADILEALQEKLLSQDVR